MTKHETSGVRTRLETITPAKARLWLNSNDNNRPVRDLHIKSLAQAIRAGEWRVNGETIKFCGSKVRDGQHRLHAIILADISVQSFVTRGLSSGCFDTIDRGKARSNSDLLSRHGHTNTTALAASLAWLWRDENNKMSYSGDLGRPRGQQVIAMAEEHPGMAGSIVIGSKARNLLPLSVSAYSHYIFGKKDRELADVFFASLAGGEGLSRGDPVYTLREQLQNNRGQAAKLRTIVIVAYIRLAWNAVRGGKKLRKLHWDPSEGIPEVK